ncbi:hypothetical protein STA3757_02250 [Stanieria sp. NIES-3757]|nr:hypothetical protein STA3757_02250 [Stanieria sp. NIES-3757]
MVELFVGWDKRQNTEAICISYFRDFFNYPEIIEFYYHPIQLKESKLSSILAEYSWNDNKKLLVNPTIKFSNNQLIPYVFAAKDNFEIGKYPYHDRILLEKITSVDLERVINLLQKKMIQSLKKPKVILEELENSLVTQDSRLFALALSILNKDAYLPY